MSSEDVHTFWETSEVVDPPAGGQEPPRFKKKVRKPYRDESWIIRLSRTAGSV